MRYQAQNLTEKP